MKPMTFLQLSLIAFFVIPTYLLAQVNTDTKDKIRAIESSLITENIVRGEQTIGMSIFERMKFYKVPGVSIAVINNGIVEWAKGYGLKQIGIDDSVKSESLFQAASVSKPVSSMAAVKLVQDGKLTLGEDVNTKLISWKIPDNNFTVKEKVTLEKLLSHTAGTSVSGFIGYSTHDSIPTLIEILDGKKPANSAPIRVEAEPGSKWSYSGGGYVIAQQLMQDVEQKDFNSILSETIFQKLGMTNSAYEQHLTDVKKINAASGHKQNGTVIKGNSNIYPESAAAGLWTTATDLAKFVIEIQKSLIEESNLVLTKQSVEEMLRVRKNNYSLGFNVSGNEELKKFEHGGSNVGFKSYFVGYFYLGKGFAALSNGDNGLLLIMEIMRALSNAYDWPDYKHKEKIIFPIDCKIYDSYAGKFKTTSNNQVVTISKAGNKLFVEIPFLQSNIELLPESESSFFIRELPYTVTFKKEKDGKVNSLSVSFIGTAVRIE